MCGIAAACIEDAERGRLAVEAMCEHMLARGPDDHGVEALAARGAPPVVLGSRRLAIIDPSPAGHQPMVDPERETAIVFNGMIYNFAELRERLRREGETFASSCDTEVLLKAYGRYGPDCVRQLEGMFAFAVWDGRRRELFLARALGRLVADPELRRSYGERSLERVREYSVEACADGIVTACRAAAGARRRRPLLSRR